jgi:hypothetical protein
LKKEWYQGCAVWIRYRSFQALSSLILEPARNQEVFLIAHQLLLASKLKLGKSSFRPRFDRYSLRALFSILAS